MDDGLSRSAFARLGVSTRDNRRRIVEIAQEKLLEQNPEVYQKAQSELTNPRTRLGAEIAWLPGVSPKRGWQILSQLHHDPARLRNESGLPVLARLNVLAAMLETRVDSISIELSALIRELADLVEELQPANILRDINDDRLVSGFPQITSIELLEPELNERRRYYRSAIKSALDCLPSTELVGVMNATVDRATQGGEQHAPTLIDDLVDSYEVETQDILQSESATILNLIDGIRALASSGEDAIQPYVDRVGLVLGNWCNIARPIQLSSKARGTDHAASRKLAYAVRGLAVDLFNEHDFIGIPQQLTDLVSRSFPLIPEIAERAEADANHLTKMQQQQGEALARKAEWDRAVSYRAEIGLISKNTLSISAAGVSWKGRSFPLDTITRVRWGGIRNSVNGIPTGTNYTIGFGDNNVEAIVELSKKDVFAAFTEKLWQGVGVRLLSEMIDTLKAGQSLRFGEALLHDDGATLVRRRILKTNESVHCPWSEIEIWSRDGDFYLGSKTDKKTFVSLSYINCPNTHVVEQAVRLAFKKPGMRRLSDLTS